MQYDIEDDWEYDGYEYRLYDTWSDNMSVPVFIGTRQECNEFVENACDNFERYVVESN